MQQNLWPRAFADVHKFQDDVWGQITLNTLERDVIDTPEYQRLFRTSQLGFIDLVYQTANHTRGAHSIGACHVANDLMNRLAKNAVHDCEHSRYAPITISPAERVLIRLGALLHDITHVPFSHDVERKSHKVWFNKGQDHPPMKIRSHYGHYDKHDDYDSNPLLYLVLFDRANSVLARVLAAFSLPYYNLLLQTNCDDPPYAHLKTFVSLLKQAQGHHGWDLARELLPALLFHLLTNETEEDAKPVRRIVTKFWEGSPELIDWGLGPPPLYRELHESWYQPFRHDIIGNTLSADLIDYLKRDMCRLGLDREIDLHLLNYYVLVNPNADGFASERTSTSRNGSASPNPPPRYRCAIEIQDHKRGTSRVVLINDIFRLLDLRQEIHEKAVMHRVVQSAIAMFSRALLLLDDQKPSPAKLVRLGDETHALQGEDLFLQSLLEIDPSKAQTRSVLQAQQIIRKLIDRRVYRPLLIIPGDRAASHFKFAGNKDGESDEEYRLRTLAAVVDSSYYSPFLLFVSMCIEEFLLGLCDTSSEVMECVTKMVKDHHRMKNAMQVVPSRAIIWTTPYKQLYKDPAVVVALRDTVGRIDDLGKLQTSDAPADASLVKLIQTSIEDADSKYASLWKLYVFISDGLYYTGILNKLKACRSGSGSTRKCDEHVIRLRNAESFVVVALDLIREDWSDYCEREYSSTKREERLRGRMPEDRFVALVDLWVARHNAREDVENNPTRGLSEVDVQHYVHEWDTSGCPIEDRCRDIRYKYPSPASEDWREAKAMPPTAAERQLVEFLEKCGVTDSSVLSHAEFKQLVSQFDPDTAKRCSDLLEAHSKGSLDASHLCVLWRSVLKPLERQPRPTAREGVLFPDDQQQGEEMPATAAAIEQWLLNEARVLEPNVRKQFTTNSEALAELVFSYPPALRTRIFGDLRTRLLNESKLLNNNMKSEEMVAQLRRKWDTFASPGEGTPSSVEENL